MRGAGLRAALPGCPDIRDRSRMRALSSLRTAWAIPIRKSATILAFEGLSSLMRSGGSSGALLTALRTALLDRLRQPGSSAIARSFTALTLAEVARTDRVEALDDRRRTSGARRDGRARSCRASPTIAPSATTAASCMPSRTAPTSRCSSRSIRRSPSHSSIGCSPRSPCRSRRRNAERRLLGGGARSPRAPGRLHRAAQAPYRRGVEGVVRRR